MAGKDRAGAGVALPLAGLSPQQAVSALTSDAKAGWRTTEFWIAIMTWLLPILALIFHRDLSSLAMPLAAVAAGGANAAYSVSRAVTKNGHAKAVAAMTATPAGATATAVVPVASPAGGAAALTAGDATELLKTMTAALQALTAAVAKIPAQKVPAQRATAVKAPAGSKPAAEPAG